MAGLAQRHAGVVLALFDVVCVRGAGHSAYRAGLLFDQPHPCALILVVATVHNSTKWLVNSANSFATSVSNKSIDTSLFFNVIALNGNS